eukprot:scaffold399899_cov18-Prasinocladus_malaysianus.AAC.1
MLGDSEASALASNTSYASVPKPPARFSPCSQLRWLETWEGNILCNLRNWNVGAGQGLPMAARE